MKISSTRWKITNSKGTKMHATLKSEMTEMSDIFFLFLVFADSLHSPNVFKFWIDIRNKIDT